MVEMIRSAGIYRSEMELFQSSNYPFYLYNNMKHIKSNIPDISACFNVDSFGISSTTTR